MTATTMLVVTRLIEQPGSLHQRGLPCLRQRGRWSGHPWQSRQAEIGHVQSVVTTTL